MRLTKSRALIWACAAALLGLTASAGARPVHHHATAPAAQSLNGGTIDGRYAFMRWDWKRRHSHANKHAHARRGRRHHAAKAKTKHAPASVAKPLLGGAGGSALVAEARKYLGTNPTGRKRLWCGAFMDMVLKRTGHKGGGNLALGYEHYGHRVSGPQVGAIAVMRRRGGGHVGVVAGVDANGNPIIVSGNHNHTVAESVYPRRRIVAYVEPNN